MQPSLRRLSRVKLPFATARRLGVPPTVVSSGLRKKERVFSTLAPRWQAVETSAVAERIDTSHTPKKSLIEALPPSCPGCGAPSQTVAPDLAGYYSADMSHVKAYLRHDQEHEQPNKREDDIYAAAVANLDPSLREQLGVTESTETPPKSEAALPLCNRCHRLINHREGVPIDHPSIQAIRAMIQESPHKRNHIYHVVDAADFPMSVIPDITRALDIAPLRSRGRRASKRNWFDGKHTNVEFIITRADLLVPQEDMSRKLMAYIIEVLREKIGREYRDNVRLGNVHLVSAQRGWWTPAIKQKILKRGGASWFVGKVNVGKSSLFEVVFPKGQKDYVDIEQVRKQAEKEKKASWDSSNSMTQKEREDAEFEAKFLADPEDILKEEAEESKSETEEEAEQPVETSESIDLEDSFSTTSLLPPPQKEVDYPVMPIISHLPGTTASPIRIPFARGRGELIDLPGLDRNSMDQYVAPQHRSKLLLKSRKKTERIVLKPHESLVLGGGLVRITPATEDLIYLVHPFVELPWHKSSTEKAVARERGEIENARSGIVNWADEKARSEVRSAGVVSLSHDVTKAAAGPLARKDVVGLKAINLPFVVWAVDVLIEGLGWVEVTAQTRRFKRRPIYASDDAAGERKTEEQPQTKHEVEVHEDAKPDDQANTNEPPSPETNEEASPWSTTAEESSSQFDSSTFDPRVVPFPQIQVFSPYGACIGSRQSLMGSILNAPRKAKVKERPRQSMKAVKARRPKGTQPGEAPDTVARGVRR
ncbi:hypothetical protein HDK77DRAFT_374145 [Phyllosticta capitalensis]